MVNSQNVIDGVAVGSHPLGGPAVYVKGVTVLATQAVVGGVINTRDGQRRYQAGDWILTDNPPTTAWTVNDQVFRAQYRSVDDPVSGNVTEQEEAYLKRAQLAKDQTEAQRIDNRNKAEVKAAVKRAKPEPRLPGRANKTADSESLKALT